MEHKNSMSRVERLRREKVTRYSIRKYSFGAASVAVAALFMFLGNGAVSVQADEIQGNQVTESAKPQPEEDKSKPATEVAPALNKTQLESYISEIETKLSNGFYDNKTEESVAALKADLEAAKATLANATTQAELKQAYSKLVTTVNSKLKNKPVEKKEIPAVDTTEGKETVGKKAENTEPSATNSHAIPAKAEEGSGFRRNDSGAPQVTDTVNYTDGAGVPRRGVTSADASLSGTGTNGKTVEVTVETPDRGTRVYSALVTNGKWTVPLEEPLKASRDAFNKDQHETKITVKYIDVNNILNDETRVYLGRPEFVNNTVVAGQKEVLVKVPKDADNLWVGFANSNDLQVAMNNGNPESKDTSILTATMADTQNDPIFHIVKLTFVQNAIKEGSNGINIQAQSLYSAAGGALPGATEAPEAKRPTLTATNEAPTIASAVEGNRKTVAQGAQLDLASLVTVADTEDDAQVTVGNKVHAEVVSVNGDAATKTVDTNTQGTYTVKYKAVDSQGKESNEIEVTVVVNPAENEAPTVEIPFSNGKDVYVYGAEPSGFDIKIKDNSGVIKSATVLRGGNNSFNPVAGETDMLDVQYGYKANIFTSDTTASEQSPAIIHYRGLPGGELNAGQLEKAKTTGLTLGWRYVRVVDKAGNMLDNIAQGDKSKDRDLGAFNVIVKPQTYKYDPVELANANKVLVTNPAQLTTEELTNVKNSLKVEYSKTNDDAQLASKKGTLLDDAKTVVADVTESGNNFTVIYKDGSTDSIAKSKLIKSGAAPTVNTTIKASGSIPDSVPSSDSELTGTGIPGATVKVTVKNPETGAVISEKTAVVGEDGTWRLPLEEGLNSNTQLPGANEATRRFFAPKNPVEITQVVNGIETPSKAVSVAVGESKILPSAAAIDGASVVAGAKEVTITVPHDAGRSYFFYTAKGAKSTTEIALEQSQNGWSIIKNGDKATIKSVEKGVSVHTITLTMNENAPFQEGENKLEIISHNGPSSPPSRFGRYKINVTNEKPTLASKNAQLETTVNVGDTVDPVSLVTVADHEDDKDATLGTKVRAEVISVNGDESVKTVDTTTAGRYEVKYKAVDSQGKESDVLTHTVIVQGPAPTVEVPYSNQANKQIYVYTGEKTDLTFKGADETEVKDLYLRGPGDISKDNTTDYGFTTGKITDGTVTTGVGEVSADKRTATVKMTGKTNLAAGKEWTSFVVSKDNDGKLSNTDYRAIDVDPNAKEKPGYVRFVVKNQTSKYDIATPTERVAVTDPANVTQDELDKIKEKLQIEYSKNNDDANLAEKKGKAVAAEDAKTKIQSVEKDANGNLVVTYTDGSKDTRSLSDFVVKNPAVTPVKDPANLTDAEKAKVEEAVKKANPTATKVEVGNDGTTTVTFPDGSTGSLTPEKTAKTADSNGLVDPAVTPVKDPANLTDAEKAKVEEAVKKANPTATKVEVGNDGTTTVTFPDGSTTTVTPDKTVKSADSNGAKDPSVTPVKDPANLTDAEKAKVADEVKKANPTAKDVEVGKDGTATVTFPDGSTAVIPADKSVKKSDGLVAVSPAANQDSPAQAPAKKAGAKELPNTGTEQSNASLALALLAAATGGLLFAKKREEEE